MTVVSSSFKTPPEDIITSIICFNNDREKWPYVSKKCLILWLQAAYEAIENAYKKNPVLFKNRPVFISTDDIYQLLEQSRKLDQFFRQIATCLVLGQSILPIDQRINLSMAQKYRDAERLENLSRQIQMQEDRNLVAFAEFLQENNASAKEQLREIPSNLTTQKKAEQIREIVNQGKDNSQRRIIVPLLNLDQLTDRERTALPPEFIEMEVSLEVLHQGIVNSIHLRFLPFVKHFLASPKSERVSVDQLGTYLWYSIYYQDKDCVRLLLENRRISVNSYKAGLNRLNSPEFTSDIKCQMAILKLFLSTPHVPEEALASGLINICKRDDDVELKNRFAIVSRYLAAPVQRISCEARKKALLNLVVNGNLSQEDRFTLIRRFLSDRHSKDAWGEAIVRTLSTDWNGDLAQEDRIAFIREFCLIPNGIFITNLEAVFALATKGSEIRADRIAMMNLILNDPRFSLQKRADSMLQRIQADETITHQHNREDMLFIFETILQHPSTTSPLLWKLIVTLHWATSLADTYYSSNPYNLSYADYSATLAQITAHREAVNMPIAAKTLLAFERAIIWITWTVAKDFPPVLRFIWVSVICLPLFPIHMIRMIIFTYLVFIRKFLS